MMGLGLHIQDVDTPKAQAVYYCELFQWVMEHAYTFSIAASQLSLLALYHRAFDSVPDAKLIIVALQICVASWLIARVVLSTAPGAFFPWN
jgi:hypothetical protein